MGIDIRATVTCSLGPLISASVSDDYIQGNGLVKTKGSCELRGIFTPNIGDKVTFQYTKGGITRRLPRTLRVLSSFADPFRFTTKIELGCKLTYLEGQVPAIDSEAFNDPLNQETQLAEDAIITVPITASSIMEECLKNLGIFAYSTPLTNTFNLSEFDFSPGYVQVLSDLLVSESYCGYLDLNETLVVFSLNSYFSSGPLIDKTKIIDVGPIGVGQLPGDAVYVRYNTLQYRFPEGTEVADEDGRALEPIANALAEDEDRWTPDRQIASIETPVGISYTDENGEYTNRVFNTFSTTSSVTTYKLIEDVESDRLINVVDNVKTTETRSAVSVLPNLFTELLSEGSDIGDYTINSVTNETFEYNNRGEETYKSLVKTGSGEHMIGSLGIDLVYEDLDGNPVTVNIPENVLLERVEVYSTSGIDSTGTYTGTTTLRYGPWYQSIAGQQSIARAREFVDNVEDANDLITNAVLGLYLLDRTSVVTRQGFKSAAQPTLAETAQDSFSTGTSGGSNASERVNAAEIEVVSGPKIEVVSGPKDAQRRVEFTMPYAPDDFFSQGFLSTYSVNKVDASNKARIFGSVQNRMLLGNRSGMNIQVAAEVLPPDPFAPVFIEATGTYNLYRLNGTSWTMDASGIVVSSDAMFWGVAGRSA
jgi:hypothetical protein